MSVSGDKWLAGGTVTPEKKSQPRVFTITRNRVSTSDVAWMCSNLATMQEAGLPLFQSINTLATMRKGTPLGQRLQTIYDEVGEGMSFSQAVRRFEKDFEPLTCALIEAGEASGNLATALYRASELLDTRLRIRRKVRSAMAYPAIVLVVTSILISALLVFIVPRFEDIYTEAGGDLPLMTQGLISLSQFLPFILLLVLTVGIVLAVLSRASQTRTSTRLFLDKVRLRIPVVGSLLIKAANARVAATLANLLSAGVPLLDALALTANTANNEKLSQALGDVSSSIDEGMGFAAAMEVTGQFPEILVQLTAVGEESGSLPKLMLKYSKVAEEEVLSTAETMTSVLEPLLMVFVGLIVGVFLVGLYLPLISISDQIK